MSLSVLNLVLIESSCIINSLSNVITANIVLVNSKYSSGFEFLKSINHVVKDFCAVPYFSISICESKLSTCCLAVLERFSIDNEFALTCDFDVTEKFSVVFEFRNVILFSNFIQSTANGSASALYKIGSDI